MLVHAWRTTASSRMATIAAEMEPSTYLRICWMSSLILPSAMFFFTWKQRFSSLQRNSDRCAKLMLFLQLRKFFLVF